MTLGTTDPKQVIVLYDDVMFNVCCKAESIDHRIQEMKRYFMNESSANWMELSD